MLCVFMSDGLQLLYRSVCVFDVKKQQSGATESLHQYWSLPFSVQLDYDLSNCLGAPLVRF
jgi:hypothetical protein